MWYIGSVKTQTDLSDDELNFLERILVPKHYSVKKYQSLLLSSGERSILSAEYHFNPHEMDSAFWVPRRSMFTQYREHIAYRNGQWCPIFSHEKPYGDQLVFGMLGDDDMCGGTFGRDDMVYPKILDRWYELTARVMKQCVHLCAFSCYRHISYDAVSQYR